MSYPQIGKSVIPKIPVIHPPPNSSYSSPTDKMVIDNYQPTAPQRNTGRSSENIAMPKDIPEKHKSLKKSPEKQRSVSGQNNNGDFNFQILGSEKYSNTE